MKTNEQTGKAEYRTPRIVSPGNAAELTFGNGTVYPDSLGNPATSYGKHREAEAAVDSEAGLLNPPAGSEEIRAPRATS